MNLNLKEVHLEQKGDIVEIYPSDQSETAIRVEFWGDEVEKISEINPLTGKSNKYKATYYDIPKFSLCNNCRQNGKGNCNNTRRTKRKSKIF